MQVGFIGLGRMGSGLAKNLVKAGYALKVYDLDPKAVASLVQMGAQATASARELARVCDVLFTSLPLPRDVETTLIGESGCLSVLPEKSTVIDVSTIDPQTAIRIAEAFIRAGRSFLACPLGKGPVQAAEGSEPIFAGGQKEIFEQHRALLEKIGQPVFYLGDVEQSTSFKLISNLIGMTNMAVLVEGLALGAKAGIDPQQLQDLLMTTGADSFQLQMRGPWILSDDYAPRFSIDLAAKDLRLGVAMARDWDTPVPFGKLAHETYRHAQEQGLGSEDTAAIYKIKREVKDDPLKKP
jgi:3-hydroxyisobutyrate dehydrogenase-like beta-hydroxyacid dehydrogenase